jgi:hypothetical protein
MVRMISVACAAVVLGIASTCEASADQCDAVAGELAARVSGAKIGRRSAVAIFAFHPAVKYSSIGCLNTKSVNFFADVESKYPGASFFEYFGAAAAIALGGDAEEYREGATRCLKQALAKGGVEDTNLQYGNLSFQCSADNISSSVVVQRR